MLGLEAADFGVPAKDLTRAGFAVTYDAAARNYVIEIPSKAAFRFQSESEDPSYWRTFVAGGGYSGTFVDIFKPTSTNPEIQLAYTSFGVTDGYYSSNFGFFAFGIPTPTSGVPVTGSATYNALVAGRPLDISGVIHGNATFQFNFGAGTLSGHLNPVLNVGGINTSLGTYNFVNTVFGVGSPTFSGALSRSGANSLGAFDGRFTGPAAQELMSRWTAPYLNPSTQQWNEMFGVMVGKKP